MVSQGQDEEWVRDCSLLIGTRLHDGHRKTQGLETYIQAEDTSDSLPLPGVVPTNKPTYFKTIFHSSFKNL